MSKKNKRRSELSIHGSVFASERPSPTGKPCFQTITENTPVGSNSTKWPRVLCQPDDPLENWLRQQAQSILGCREPPSATVAWAMEEAGLLRCRLSLRDAPPPGAEQLSWLRSFVRRVCGMIRTTEGIKEAA